MEKKFKFSDNPTLAKTVYGAVIALLCISAIVVGIIAANNRRKDNVDDPPVIDNGGENGGEGENGGNTGGNENGGGENGGEGGNGEMGGESGAVTFTAPAAGKITTSHSTEIPVFSETLEVWKIHTGVDIATEEGASVFAVADGEVTRVYSAALLGKTVEITHSNGIKTVYSNLAENVTVEEGKKVSQGEKLGTVGDSAISELADEAHLHFEVLVNGNSVNPLDYIGEESKKTSLGITEGDAA